MEISLEREQAFARRSTLLRKRAQRHNAIADTVSAGLATTAAEQRTIDAQMHRFHDMIRSCLPDAHRKEPVFKSPPTDAVRNQWFDVTPGTALPLKDPSYTQQKHQSLVASLSIRVPQRDHEHLARLWMACINEFVRPRVCHLRISGTIEELELHRCVDRYPEHPWSITQGYGLLIENVSQPSHQDSGLTSLLQSGHAPTSSWDLRLEQVGHRCIIKCRLNAWR